MTHQIIEIARSGSHPAASPFLRFIRGIGARLSQKGRRERLETRCVRLYMRDDGTISLEGQDLGPGVEEMFGDSDYEYWVDVPDAGLQKLAFELLREKYAGQLNAVEAFRDWCKTHGVAHEFSNYM